MKKYACFLSLLLFLSLEKGPDALQQLSPAVPLLQLKWNKAYQDDSIDKSVIGLKWALSFVGAQLPKSQTGISYSDTVITLDAEQLGFSENAKKKLAILHSKIIHSEEYQTTRTIDLGRYITLLIGVSEHYFELVGTPEKLNEVLARYELLQQKGYVDNSGVSLEHRVIRFSEQNGYNQLLLAEEIDTLSGEIHEYETIELLPNGQVRFGIFDAEGNRKDHVDPAHSNAGKPAKCMWCHESNIQPIFYPLKDVAGYVPSSELKMILDGYRQANVDRKLTLADGVDFSQTQQHTLTELLYISFMEPSAERLALEWNLPLAKTQKKLAGLPTHVYAEFPFLGNLYFRQDIEKLAPFRGLKVPGSVREPSAVEVNHLK